MMTYSAPRISAVAFSVAALSLASLSAARADSSAAPASNPAPTSSAAPSTAPTPPARPASPAPASTAAAPSLAEPAPTPGWAEAGPGRTTVAQHPAVRSYAHRRYAYRNGRRYYHGNAVANAATGVAGGVADLGSIAAYPFYCFPNYGSCSVRVPYRY
jgi:hypothetical protein